jgi:putative peptidoglycan binding protein
LRYRNSILGMLATIVLAMLLLAVPESLMAETHHRRTPQQSSTGAPKPASSKSKKTGGIRHSGRRSRHSRNWRHHGQQKVDVRRTQQIQQALIRSHYLDGDPSGAWDTKTQEALRRYQAANGWQTKVVPDSRALIMLGLGPSNDRLLNPQSAMTSHPDAPTSGAAASDPGTPRQ